MQSKLKLNYFSWWLGRCRSQVVEKKSKLMLYSTLVVIEVEVGVELGNNILQRVNTNWLSCRPDKS